MELDSEIDETVTGWIEGLRRGRQSAGTATLGKIFPRIGKACGQAATAICPPYV